MTFVSFKQHPACLINGLAIGSKQKENTPSLCSQGVLSLIVVAVKACEFIHAVTAWQSMILHENPKANTYVSSSDHFFILCRHVKFRVKLRSP